MGGAKAESSVLAIKVECSPAGGTGLIASRGNRLNPVVASGAVSLPSLEHPGELPPGAEPVGVVRGSARTEKLRFVLGLLAVAISAALFAALFRMALELTLHGSLGYADVVSAMREVPWYGRLWLPALGGLGAGAIGMMVLRLPGASGVGAVMEAVVLGRVRLSMRATLLRSFASWMALVSGGSLGREGPLIQFGGAAGTLFGGKFRLDEQRTRILVASGAAAGFAAAYNTPFAAIFFVLEVVTGVVVLDTLVPTLVATVLATQITRSLVGEGPIYGVRDFQLQSPAELLAFAALGLVAALVASGFMRLLSWAEQKFDTSSLPRSLRPALGGLLAGALVAVLPEVAGNGYEPLNELLDMQHGVAFVALLLVGKVLATTASVSSGSPGGVFTPTLVLGGCVGFLFAAGLEGAGIGLGLAGGYVLVGMAAATAATTHAPIMAAVMACELSGDWALALPLLLASAVATGVSRSMRSESLYSEELRERGIGWVMTIEGRKRVVFDPPGPATELLPAPALAGAVPPEAGLPPVATGSAAA